MISTESKGSHVYRCFQIGTEILSMLPFANIAAGQYDIIEDDIYLELMSHMYLINAESSREKLVTGRIKA